MQNGSAAFLSVSAVSAVSALGYLGLGFQEQRLRRLIFVLVSFAVGALFGDVFLHLVPELYGSGLAAGLTSAWLLAGFLGFFALEKFLRWRHCHVPEQGHAHPVVTLTLMGDSAHNLVDGMLIGASWNLSPAIGLATSLAVFFHELPAELGHFGVLIHGGLTPRRALFYNFLTSLTSFIGLGLALALPTAFGGATHAISAAAAGGFLYVAGSDLVPELHHELDAGRSALQFLAILAGIGVMALLAATQG
jgi:zinc and cadmium transporter